MSVLSTSLLFILLTGALGSGENDSTKTLAVEVNDIGISTYALGVGVGADPVIVTSKQVPGLCIHAEQGLISGSLMKMARCTQDSTQFRWNRDTQQIQAEADSHLCVDLTSSHPSRSEAISELLDSPDISPQNTMLQLQPCVADAAHQQFFIGSSIKSKARPDLCITPDASLFQANTTSAPLEVDYCNSAEKSQDFRYIGADGLLESYDMMKESAHTKHRAAANQAYSGHSTTVGASGKVKHIPGRKPASTNAKLLNLDISEAQHGELMRRNPPARLEHEQDSVRYPNIPTEKSGTSSSSSNDAKHHQGQQNSPNPDLDALLERIGDGLIEDEDDDEELSAEDLDAMLDRAVVAKRRRPPPPPPVPPKINCAWGKWGKWSSCTADCGGGTKDRSRGERIPAENGGLPCDGEAEEEKKCATKPCSPPPPPPTTPPAATTPPPMMAKGGAKGTMSMAPVVSLVMFLASSQWLNFFQ